MPNIQSFLLLMALTAATPSHAAVSPPESSKPRARPVLRDPPRWDRNPQLTKSFLARLTQEIAQVAFGTPWPKAIPARPECVSFVGDIDDLFEIRNWVYACDSPREGGIRTDYYYILEGKETPTLEGVRYAIVAAPDARVEDWGKIQSALLDDLSAALEIPKWRDRDYWEKIGIGRDRIVEEKLFTALPDTGKASATAPNFTLLNYRMADSTGVRGYIRNKGSVREEMRPIGGNELPKTAEPTPPPRRTRATVESLVVYCFSQKLEAETHEASWDLRTEDSTIKKDSTIAVYGWHEHAPHGRPEVIRELRRRGSALATVLESTRATADQIRIVDATVSTARRSQAGAEKDLILYAAHLWANGLVGDLQGNPSTDCNGADTTLVHEFNSVFSRRDRSRIECDHYGAWWYSGGFIDSVVPRAGQNRWADYAFLDRTSDGWSLDYGCGSEFGSDEFRPVIARGEEFLRANPSSEVAPELRLLVAEAHETAWSIGKMFQGSQYVSSTVYASDAPSHRTRAIALYELQLRERPDDPRNAGIRKRLARMRIDVDTGYRLFWCSNE